jgi:hypothetical protein
VDFVAETDGLDEGNFDTLVDLVTFGAFLVSTGVSFGAVSCVIISSSFTTFSSFLFEQLASLHWPRSSFLIIVRVSLGSCAIVFLGLL